MSLIEVLVAVLLMATVAVSILPIFVRSMRQNREGGNFTDLTNVARSSLEEHLQLDINAPRLTLAVGSNELILHEYWNAVQRRWLPLVDPANPPAGARWHRAVQVQQFSSGDLIDDGWLDNPRVGGTPADQVQLKLIRVTVRPLWRNNELGPPTPISMEVIKAL
jgi:type II secretory pathway pseudopilin PulG